MISALFMITGNTPYRWSMDGNSEPYQWLSP